MPNNQQQFNQLVSFIWNIANDVLVQVFNKGDYKKVILPMMVLRRLDILLEPTKEAVLKQKEQLDKMGITNQSPVLMTVTKYPFYNTSKFTMKTLTSETNPMRLKMNFLEYLDGYSKDVQDIIEKFKLKQQVDNLSENNRLGSILDKFTDTSINLGINPIIDADGKEIMPGVDNHMMGTVFEELLRKFNEENSVTEAGEHFTPRDYVHLLSDLAVIPIADKIESTTYSIYDGACGTGGILTISKEQMQSVAEKKGKKVQIHTFGQELQPDTYATCKADIMISGELRQFSYTLNNQQRDYIAFGSTISQDGHRGETYDFCISNPPFGTPWKEDLKNWGLGEKDKNKITDARFVVQMEGRDEPVSFIPGIGDPQMLFLANNVSRMKNNTPLGTRIVEVHNGSSLFTGNAGGGESNLRQYIIENDLLEAIVAMPEKDFYNTGIGTFIWVVTNKKEERRKGKVQLIDATAIKTPLRKNLGEKNCETNKADRKQILDLLLKFEENEQSRIFPNAEFGFWEITVLRPLCLRVVPDADYSSLKADEITTCREALSKVPANTPLDDWNKYDKALKLTKTLKNKLRALITVKDENAVPIDGEADKDLTDTEQVPFLYNGGIDGFMQNEVLPYVPDAYVDEDKTKVGYELSFTKYFYKPLELRPLDKIKADLMELEDNAETLRKLIMESESEIATVVTKGLNPNAPMKDSGIGWIGKIPEHWELNRNKVFLTEKKDVVGKDSNNYTLLSLTKNGVIPRDVESGKGKFPKEFDSYKIVNKGDIIFCLFDIDETPRTVGLSQLDGMVTGAYDVFSISKINKKYFYYLYLSIDDKKGLRPLYTGLRKVVKMNTFLSSKCPVPPIEEQQQIVEYIESKVAKIEEYIALLKTEIERMQEYKQRLISDTVTGKIKVME